MDPHRGHGGLSPQQYTRQTPKNPFRQYDDGEQHQRRDHSHAYHDGSPSYPGYKNGQQPDLHEYTAQPPPYEQHSYVAYRPHADQDQAKPYRAHFQGHEDYGNDNPRANAPRYSQPPVHLSGGGDRYGYAGGPAQFHPGNIGPQPQAVTKPRGPQLEGMPELNLLVLGETGVGKSTFINAFVNYIYFQSLDEALQRKSLQCVIPSSFSWQSLHGDEYVSETIHVRPTSGDYHDDDAADEKDGTSGQSATQYTKTYAITINGTTIRLIDTPGIGDTRGFAQDKQNMIDILTKLRKIDVLHGILILLKPNNARLTVQFKFCLKELLTHLHNDAAKNIVFGLTNARNTSFRPGETFATLKSTIDTDKLEGITLNRKTIYCFDSESFRVLAAHQNGKNVHDMGDIQDYRISWDKSAAETYRMLEHFKPSVVLPHSVKDTWDLHTTRELVRILTKPMADITQTINQNIALLKDEQCDLTDALAKNEVLETALHTNQVVYSIKELDQPRTVCSDAACVEYKDGKKHHKSLCHAPCYLENVEVDKIQVEALMYCYAFTKGNNCIECGHSWQLHLHVLWEPVLRTERVEDQAVSLRLQESKSGIEVMEEAIRLRQERVKKYRAERGIIQKAAGQFAVFLKRSSIKPWNDSKLEYLDHLIDEEKGKVQAGGSDKRLRDLQADRQQHAEEIDTLTQYAQEGQTSMLLDQEGIKKTIAELYALELTGADLKKVAKQLEDIQNSANEKGRAFGSRKAGPSSQRPLSLGFPTRAQSKRADSHQGAAPLNQSFAEMLLSQQQKKGNEPEKGSGSGHGGGGGSGGKGLFKALFGD